MIFYGPPGTGKTYLAQRLARHLTGGKPENVQLVQFHPAYSYEDFFEGYRPSKRRRRGAVAFELTPGPLRRLVDAARAHPERAARADHRRDQPRRTSPRSSASCTSCSSTATEPVRLLYGSDEAGFSPAAERRSSSAR